MDMTVSDMPCIMTDNSNDAYTDYYCYNAFANSIKVSAKDQNTPVNFCGIQVWGTETKDLKYKIVDDYGYCLTVGNFEHWVRDDKSTYIVGNKDEDCALWTPF
jgi:hypothetical protein